ncbi:MAG: hypothetical protein KDB21_00505 [Acidimicrobiales bacterium]|nr:hypothetical protein [Acidimicrobiales bacterium]
MAWSVHACSQLEAAGVPSVSILTEQFLPMGRAAAANRGFDGLHFEVLPTGFDNWSVAEISAELAHRLPAIVGALSRD